MSEGVRELDQEKLRPLLRPKYRAIADAVDDLGDPAEIGKVFGRSAAINRTATDRERSAASAR